MAPTVPKFSQTSEGENVSRWQRQFGVFSCLINGNPKYLGLEGHKLLSLRPRGSVNPIPDAKTVIAQLPLWFEHYNTLHPHKALGYRSPREFLDRQTEI